MRGFGAGSLVAWAHMADSHIKMTSQCEAEKHQRYPRQDLVSLYIVMFEPLPGSAFAHLLHCFQCQHELKKWLQSCREAANWPVSRWAKSLQRCCWTGRKCAAMTCPSRHGISFHPRLLAHSHSRGSQASLSRPGRHPAELRNTQGSSQIDARAGSWAMLNKIWIWGGFEKAKWAALVGF